MLRAMSEISLRLLAGYGAFFALTGRLSNLLLFATTMLNPIIGLMGALGGTLVILTRQAFALAKNEESVEVVNGILLGMLIGSTYAVTEKVIIFLAIGCILIVALSAILRDTFCHFFRLPLLGLPYVTCSFLLLPMMSTVSVPAGAPLINFDAIQLTHSPLQILAPLGSLYFHGTTLGGLTVFVAFFLGSPCLAIIALGASVVSNLILTALGFYPGTISFLIAQMNSILVGAVIGGLYTKPGKRSIAVAMFASGLCAILSMSIERLLSIEALPALAAPFVLTTYGVLIALAPHRGGAWTNFWLAVPALPEKTIEMKNFALARGHSDTSVSLKAPFGGTWTVYQGFNGQFTHRANWKHALDFFQIVDGKSFRNEGDTLTDYYAYGKPVLSPCYGRVVAANSAVADNVVGDVDTVNNWGNFVLIQISTGACVLLAHLQKDSLKVEINDFIFPGQLIAHVGNSGRSPQPHLHIHVQETCYFGSRTIPFHFSGVLKTRQFNTNEFPTDKRPYSLFCRPVELENVSNPTPNPALKRALRLAVGCRHEFEFNGLSQRLEVNLDPHGQFYLLGKNSARVSFNCTDDLVACFNRQGSKDLLLDAFIMALGLTPLVEGPLQWEDLLSNRLLPASGLSNLAWSICRPFSPGLKFEYERAWDPATYTWRQTGSHKTKTLFGLFEWQIETEAKICESLGVVELMLRENGKIILKATLAGYGLREDNGIPERTILRTANV